MNTHLPRNLSWRGAHCHMDLQLDTARFTKAGITSPEHPGRKKNNKTKATWIPQLSQAVNNGARRIPWREKRTGCYFPGLSHESYKNEGAAGSILHNWISSGPESFYPPHPHPGYNQWFRAGGVVSVIRGQRNHPVLSPLPTKMRWLTTYFVRLPFLLSGQEGKSSHVCG